MVVNFGYQINSLNNLLCFLNAQTPNFPLIHVHLGYKTNRLQCIYITITPNLPLIHVPFGYYTNGLNNLSCFLEALTPNSPLGNLYIHKAITQLLLYIPTIVFSRCRSIQFPVTLHVKPQSLSFFLSLFPLCHGAARLKKNDLPALNISPSDYTADRIFSAKLYIYIYK